MILLVVVKCVIFFATDADTMIEIICEVDLNQDCFEYLYIGGRSNTFLA